MTSSTSKKVQIRRFQRESLSGFVNSLTYLSPDGVEILNLSGNAVLVPYEEVKAIYFLREFDEAGAESGRRTFSSRPKLNGLWVRMRFHDGDILEAVLPNNLLAMDPLGFTVVPPDLSYSNQRMFVPRTALAELQVLGVINSPLNKPKKKAPKAPSKDQIGLFDQ